MSIILKGIDLPEPIKNQYTHLELYVRSDGVVFDDDLEEVAQAIQMPRRHGKLIPLEDVFRAFPELEPYRQGLTGLTILEAEEER